MDQTKVQVHRIVNPEERVIPVGRSDGFVTPVYSDKPPSKTKEVIRNALIELARVAQKH